MDTLTFPHHPITCNTDDSNLGTSLLSLSPAERTGKHPPHMWSLLEGFCKLFPVEMAYQWAAGPYAGPEATGWPLAVQVCWEVNATDLLNLTPMWTLESLPSSQIPFKSICIAQFFSHYAYYGHALEMPTALCLSPVTGLHIHPPIHTHGHVKWEVTQLTACENGWHNK